jgi:hypothetical protein
MFVYTPYSHRRSSQLLRNLCEQRPSSYGDLLLTSLLLQGCLGPPVPIVQEAGWAPEPVWTQRLEEKSFASAGDRTAIAQSFSP